MRTLAGERFVEIDTGDLPEPVRTGFSAVASGERFRSRIDQLAALATSLDDLRALYFLYDLWDEVAHFVCRISPEYGHADTVVYLATASYESHNARTFVPPGRDTNVILWYDRLFELVHEISYLLPLALRQDRIRDATSDEFVALASSHLQADIEDNELFDDCFARFFQRHALGDWSVEPFSPQDLSERVGLVAYDIEHSIRYFVIGHEIAHILENHEGRTAEWHLLDPVVADGDVHVTEVSRNWDQELEADFVGFQIGRGVSVPLQVPPQLYSWAVLLFFRANEWLSGWYDDGGGSEASLDELFRAHQTHPPLHVRRRWVEEVVREVIEKAPPPLGAAVDLRVLEALDRRVGQLLGSG